MQKQTAYGLALEKGGKSTGYGLVGSDNGTSFLGSFNSG
jgi:hypothetical protein